MSWLMDQRIGNDAAKTMVSSAAGDLVLSHQQPLDIRHFCIGEALSHWAEQSPDAIFLAERNNTGQWEKLTYAQAEAESRTLARKLVGLGCSSQNPLAIVAENTIEHALLSIAAQRVGVPVAPLSLAYATLASDFSRLRYMIELIAPAAVYFGDPETCRAAIEAISDLAKIVAGGHDRDHLLGLDDASPASESAFEEVAGKVGPQSVAKLMFTSGSTGMPKAVINTQAMLCANQAMLQQVWPSLMRASPVMVDWLPWSHTFGANFTFNLALFNGGALYIDTGKPVPAAVGMTIRNLAEIQPTIYFNVPAGYEAILADLRGNKDLAAKVFARMQFAFCAAAALPQTVRDEWQQLALEITGSRLPVFAGWGSTETAPCATATWWDTDRSENIGLPLPGVEVRFAPDGDKLELRVRGPNVTPGYWRNPEATARAFDDDGFYRMGDAGKLIDEDAPHRGIQFDGRVSENFKLTSGTWVNVGALRVAVVSEGRPIIRDVVVAGSGRSEIGLLVFVNHAACQAMIGAAAAGLSQDELAMHPATIAAVREAIERYNGTGRGSSSRIACFGILPDAPRIESYEITDKGYINQRAVLSNRAEQVEALYSDPVCKIG